MKTSKIIEKAKNKGFGIIENETEIKILASLKIGCDNPLEQFLNSVGIYPKKKELNFGFVYVIQKQ